MNSRPWEIKKNEVAILTHPTTGDRVVMYLQPKQLTFIGQVTGCDPRSGRDGEVVKSMLMRDLDMMAHIDFHDTIEIKAYNGGQFDAGRFKENGEPWVGFNINRIRVGRRNDGVLIQNISDGTFGGNDRDWWRVYNQNKSTTLMPYSDIAWDLLVKMQSDIIRAHQLMFKMTRMSPSEFDQMAISHVDTNRLIGD